MPNNQDYRIFIGAFPEGELAERLQDLRRRYDPKTARITPPHVTVAGTYWRSGPPTVENEAKSIARLQAIRDRVRPFDLVLGGIHTFPPANRPVIYMGVTAIEGLLAARRALLQILGSDKHHQFAPHLTLAMRLQPTAAQAMLADLQGSAWDLQTWTAEIHALRLMQRGPADPAWRCIARLEL